VRTFPGTIQPSKSQTREKSRVFHFLAAILAGAATTLAPAIFFAPHMGFFV